MNVTVLWLVLFVVLIGLELSTMGLTTIWFAAGALVATIASAVGLPLYLQIALFIFVSVVLLFFTRPLAVKYFNKDRIKTNAESLVGKHAIIISEINNMQGIGQATIAGQEWSARSDEDEKTIAVGRVVDVVGIQGVKLIVRERKEDN